MADSLDMYAEYILEREGRELVRHEFGFATYKKVSDEIVYLVDIYVDKAHRRDGIATELSKMVAAKAKELGAIKLMGSIDVTLNGVHQSMQALIGDGFIFSHASGNGLYFFKDIGEV